MVRPSFDHICGASTKLRPRFHCYFRPLFSPCLLMIRWIPCLLEATGHVSRSLYLFYLASCSLGALLGRIGRGDTMSICSCVQPEKAPKKLAVLWHQDSLYCCRSRSLIKHYTRPAVKDWISSIKATRSLYCRKVKHQRKKKNYRDMQNEKR